MSKCWNCGVQLLDPVPVCPLCKCIVEPAEDQENCQIYPYKFAEKGIKKMKRALNIYLFAAIVAEVILIGIDYAVGGRTGWVIIVGGVFAYGYVTLKVSIQMETGYRLKMIFQTLLGVAVLFLIDLETGFNGWSLDYVLPASFILMDMALVILMIANKRNWQSYISLELLVIALSVSSPVLWYLGIVSNPVVGVVAMAFSILVFVGTMIIGGKRARDELYRRFHV